MRRMKIAAWSLAFSFTGVGLILADEAKRDPGNEAERKRICHDCAMETIDQGEISGFRFDEPGYLGSNGVIRNPLAWARFWRRHTAHYDPPPPPPPVDFRHMAILVAVQGRQSSGGGPSITIARVHRCDSVTTVRIVDDETPGPLDVITNPYHIVAVPTRCLGRLATVEFAASMPGHVPGALVGRVVAESGEGVARPIAGALIRLLRPDPNGSDPIVVAQTHSHKGGGYRFGEVPPGPYVAVAAARGFQPQEETVDIVSGETSVQDFLLHPIQERYGGIAGQVRGGVTWEASDPIFGALVRLYVIEDDASDPLPIDERITGREGRYRFLALRPGAYYMLAEAGGFLAEDANVLVPPEEVVEQHFLLQSE